MKAKTASRSAARTTASSKWEYKVVLPLSPTGLLAEEWPDQFEKQLSELGSDGWELVTEWSGRLLFKKPK